jgi:hypothetical protein
LHRPRESDLEGPALKLPGLATRRQVFYYDLLGYGRSEMRAGQNVSLEVQGRVFATLLRH